MELPVILDENHTIKGFFSPHRSLTLSACASLHNSLASLAHLCLSQPSENAENLSKALKLLPPLLQQGEGAYRQQGIWVQALIFEQVKGILTCCRTAAILLTSDLALVGEKVNRAQDLHYEDYVILPLPLMCFK